MSLVETWQLFICASCGPVGVVDMWQLWSFGSCGPVAVLDLWQLWTFGSYGPVAVLDMWQVWTTTYKRVHYMVLDPLEVGVAPAICPCIFGTGEYSISAEAAPPDLYLLMYFSL